MTIKLIIGPGEIAFNFSSTEERDAWWDNMQSSHRWPAAASEKLGPRDIRLHPEALPYAYVWTLEVS